MCACVCVCVYYSQYEVLQIIIGRYAHYLCLDVANITFHNQEQTSQYESVLAKSGFPVENVIHR